MRKTALISLGLGAALLIAFAVMVFTPVLTLKPAEIYPKDWDVETLAYFEDDPARPTEERTWLIHRQAALPEDFALILTRHVTALAHDIIITDPGALLAAQPRAFVEHRHMSTGNVVATAIFTLGTGLGNRAVLAHVGWSGEIRDSFACWWCAHDAKDARPRDLAGLIDYGEKITLHTQEVSQRTRYDARLAALKADRDIWIDAAQTFWADATEDLPGRGRLTFWQRAAQ